MKNIKTIEWDEDEAEIQVRCACFSDTLGLTRWKDDEDGFIYLHLYGGHGPYGWGLRLKGIWNLLIHGRPFTDEIVMSKETAMDLCIHLNALIAR